MGKVLTAGLVLPSLLSLGLIACAPAAQPTAPTAASKPGAAPAASVPAPAPASNGQTGLQAVPIFATIPNAPGSSAPGSSAPGSSAPGPAATSGTPAPAKAAPATPTFKPVPFLSAAPVRSFAQAGQVIDPARTYRAVLSTSKGDITVELNAKAAPVAVNNFVFLALNHFYDGTRFHRVIDGFMAQGGDPKSADSALKSEWGLGGPGYSFTAENNNGLRFDRAGVLGMARAASLSSQGSQFFITVAPADFLSGGYTVFGQVVAGQDVLSRLTRTMDSTNRDLPGAVPDLLNTVTIQVLE